MTLGRAGESESDRNGRGGVGKGWERDKVETRIGFSVGADSGHECYRTRGLVGVSTINLSRVVMGGYCRVEASWCFDGNGTEH